MAPRKIHHHIGVLDVPVFKTEIRVYTSTKALEADLATLGIPWGEDGFDDSTCNAFVSIDAIKTREGLSKIISLMMPMEADISTWIHECSHLADFVLDLVGIPLTTEHTEVKALLITELFEQLTEVMNDHKEKLRKKALAYERRMRRKAEKLNIQLPENYGFH